MATTDRRITSTTGTIPDNTAFAGTVTTNPVDSTVLTYSGSSDIEDIYTLVNMGETGSAYIFTPAGSNPLCRVLAIQNIGTNTYSIFLDRANTGLSGSAANYLFANLVAYSYANDGGASGTINGVTVEDGEGFSQPQLSPSGTRGLWHDAVLVGAGSTSFLIYETR